MHCMDMISEKFCFQSKAGLGVTQVHADKALCNASFQVYLAKASRRPLALLMHRAQYLLIIAGDAVPTAATSCMDKFVGFIVGLISRCCSRRALVQRSLCLKRLTISFSTSSIIASLFFYFVLFLHFADAALQVPLPNHTRIFPEDSAFAAW